MKPLVIAVRNTLGIDLSIFYTILARVLQAGGGVVTIGLISLYLTKEEQGYYYTFGSILAVQVFFELGLTSIITQYVAHEAIHIIWKSDKEFFGPPESLSRLASLLLLCLKVFSILAAFLFILLSVGGYLFFSAYKANQTTVNWQIPWVTTSIATALMLVVNPILAVFEGLGQVKEIAKLRMKQQILSLVSVILILVLKGGLYAQGVANLLSFFLLVGSIVFSHRKQLIFFIISHIDKWKISYRKEIFPYHYKIALSWISGYLIFQLFNPVLFATEGPVVAGKMGMTLAALNGISSISMSWISTKITLFSSLIAKREHKALDTIFNRTLKQLIVINATLLIAFIGLIKVLDALNSPFRDRFLNLTPIILLCVAAFINQIVYSWATYLRCHKEEPFLYISIINGVMCAASSILLSHYFGVNGMVAGFTVISALVGGLGGYYVFTTKKRQWNGI